MSEFWSLVTHPDLPFLRYALLAALIAAPAFGVVGSLVVVNRITYLAGAVSHSVLAGIGASLLITHWAGTVIVSPFWGAFVAAVLSALVVAWVSRRERDRADAAIGLVWSVGAALGVVFLAATPGYVDPMAYLFGNILILGADDLGAMAVLDLVVLGTAALFYPQLLALSFDEDFTRSRGLPVEALRTLLLVLTAATVVLMVSSVGVVLVITLLTLPASTAAATTRSLGRMMAVATLWCLAATVGGVVVAYALDLPSGAGIVLLASVFYAGTRIVSGFPSRKGTYKGGEA